MRIVIFGDSVVQGFWDTEGGWVQRIRHQYDTEQVKDFSVNLPTVFNLGISGDMAENVVKRLALETTARKWPSEEFMIVIAVGLNDTLVFKETEANTTELYEGELQQIVAAARQFAEKIVFVGMHAVDESRTNPVAWGDYSYTNARIWEFEQVLRKFCSDNELPVIKVYEEFQLAQEKEDMLADGVHPNDRGHQLIAELVKPVIDKLMSTN